MHNESNACLPLLFVVAITGTIRSCQKHLLRHNREQLTVLAAQAGSAAEKQRIRQLILCDTGLPKE